MRRPLIAGNWKMNITVKAAKALIQELIPLVEENDSVNIAVCPPFTALADVGEIIEDTNIMLGAQNMYPKKNGTYTGEISPDMLVDLGCDYVIIGHSERREYFKETDEFVNEKIKSALEFGLQPIVCVGENLDQNKAGETEAWVTGQVRGALKGLAASDMMNIVVAYEPIWAIGTGKTATPEDANRVNGLIRRVVAELFDQETADNLIIQYGGSMKPDNVDQLMACEHVDGGLIGGASLKARDFARIVNFQPL